MSSQRPVNLNHLFGSPDEHDADSVAAWLAEMDCRGTLDYYFKPPGTAQIHRSRLIYASLYCNKPRPG